MKRLIVALSMAAATWCTACGGSGTAQVPPPPVGGFSKASLSGQYAFSTSGEVFTANSVNATPISRVGTFTADGNGGISTGLYDVNAAGSSSIANAISGGSYTVNADGRGSITLNVSGSTLQFGITLTSNNDGLLIDETSNGNQASTGSGNFLKQTPAAFSLTSVAGPYVFDFFGLDGSGASESTVGQFSASGGTIQSGIADDDDNFTLTSSIALTGTFTADPLNMPNFGRGVAQIGSLQLGFYIVDMNHIRFLSTNGGTMLAGDATTQSGIPANASNFNSGFVFLVGGSSATGGFTQVGRFTANGTAVTQVLADANDNGNFFQTNMVSNANISSYDPATGRGVVTFKDNNLSTPFTYVFYLNSATNGVIQDVSGVNNAAAHIADGTIAAQVAGPLTVAVSSNYAFNWSGLSNQNSGGITVQDEEDAVGQFKLSGSGSTFSGAADIFQFQALAPGTNDVVSGTLNINGNGTGSDGKRATMSIKLTTTSSTTVNFVVYPVSQQLLFFASNNQSTQRNVAGVLKNQP